MDLDTFFKHASFDDGLRLIAHYDHEKHAGDWVEALKSFAGAPENKQLMQGLTMAGGGAALGGGLGAISAARSPKNRKNWLARMATGAGLGAAAGGGLHLAMQHGKPVVDALSGEKAAPPAPAAPGTTGAPTTKVKAPMTTDQRLSTNPFFGRLYSQVAEGEGGNPALAGLGAGGLTYGGLWAGRGWRGQDAGLFRGFGRGQALTQGIGLLRDGAGGADAKDARVGVQKLYDAITGSPAGKKLTSQQIHGTIARFGDQAPDAVNRYAESSRALEQIKKLRARIDQRNINDITGVTQKPYSRLLRRREHLQRLSSMESQHRPVVEALSNKRPSVLSRPTGAGWFSRRPKIDLQRTANVPGLSQAAAKAFRSTGKGRAAAAAQQIIFPLLASLMASSAQSHFSDGGAAAQAARYPGN